MPSHRAATRKEMYVALTLIAGAALWLFTPAVAQPEGYFPFADQRRWLGIPNAADVLSNLAFVAVGLLGLNRLQKGLGPTEPVARFSLYTFFIGLFLTGFGSAYFHWNPTNETLVADRLPMTVAFAGVFGAMLAERISTRSGLAVLLLMLVVGPASVFYWKATGDLSLYACGPVRRHGRDSAAPEPDAAGPRNVPVVGADRLVWRGQDRRVGGHLRLERDPRSVRRAHAETRDGGAGRAGDRQRVAAARGVPERLMRVLGKLVRGIGHVCGALLLCWATLAINFSNLPWPWLRLALAVAFAAFGIWALWITRRPRMPWVFAALFLAVCAWWVTILPSHDRDWRRDVAVMPHAVVDGDAVRISDVRDFDYRTRDDFTVRYEERTVSLSHLTGVDFYVSFWMEGPIGHTFLSFVFDNAPPLAVSIETRPEVGEGYSPLASMFKEYELIYVVGDERDLVRLRTNYRDEEVFLYHLAITPEARAPAVPGLPGAHQRAPRQTGVVPPAQQQLHDQHRQVRQRRRQNGRARHTACPQRTHRPLLLQHGSREHFTGLRRAAPALEHHGNFARRRQRRRFSAADPREPAACAPVTRRFRVRPKAAAAPRRTRAARTAAGRRRLRRRR